VFLSAIYKAILLPLGLPNCQYLETLSNHALTQIREYVN